MSFDHLVCGLHGVQRQRCELYVIRSSSLWRVDRKKVKVCLEIPVQCHLIPLTTIPWTALDRYWPSHPPSIYIVAKSCNGMGTATVLQVCLCRTVRSWCAALGPGLVQQQAVWTCFPLWLLQHCCHVPSGRCGDTEITRWKLLNAPSLTDVNSGLPIHKDGCRDCSVLECSAMASKFFDQFICSWNIDIALNWGSQCLGRVAILWNVVEGPANSFINLFAVGMLILLWTEAHNALECMEGPTTLSVIYLQLECWYYSGPVSQCGIILGVACDLSNLSWCITSGIWKKPPLTSASL